MLVVLCLLLYRSIVYLTICRPDFISPDELPCQSTKSLSLFNPLIIRFTSLTVVVLKAQYLNNKVSADVVSELETKGFGVSIGVSIVCRERFDKQKATQNDNCVDEIYKWCTENRGAPPLVFIWVI